MEVRSRGEVLWELFATIHPILMQALPQNAHGMDCDRTIKDSITKIRYVIRALPLRLPDGELDSTKLDNADFFGSLHSLLEVVETFVSYEVGEDAILSECADYDRELFPTFRRLITMKTILRTTGCTTPPSITNSTGRPQNLVLNLAKYVDFNNLEQGSPHKLAVLQQRLIEFQNDLSMLLYDPIKAFKEDLGNTTPLTRNEINFIKSAADMSELSRKLFRKLTETFTCPRIHQARLHLSGFLTSEATFELLVTDCGEQLWNSVECKLAAAEHQQAQKAACSRYQDQNAPKHISLAFDEQGLWEDEIQDHAECPFSFSDQDRTLHELVFGNDHETSLGNHSLNGQEKRIMELLVACSLLNLDTSSWIPIGLSIDKILVRATEERDNLLARWKPHVSCSLQPRNEEDDENASMLSFGILLMEMEANRKALVADRDRPWKDIGFSQDAVLRRILVDWREDVEEDYRKLATACLIFRQLTEGFRDSQLTDRAKRAGAMYRHILAPLSRLVRHRYRTCIPFFTKIPTQAQEYLPESSQEREATSTNMILYDGTETSTPTQTHIRRAKKFMHELEKFAKKIESITEASPIPISPALKVKIRIAILDTGIDSHGDILIEEALRSGRIKKCCGFVDGQATADYHDINGHGTHVTRLVLNAAPSAEIIVAKISHHKTIDGHDLHRIAKAIDWAVEERANLISMSFGLELRDQQIDQSILAAEAAHIGIFAASSNEGGNKSRSYPASKSGVLCIHASDGAGYDVGINPAPKSRQYNFTTLGVAIESRWKGDTVYLSGTSYSTPIAVALVADVLEFARHQCYPTQHQLNVLCSFGGIFAILCLMVEPNTEPRGGYDYVMPRNLWPPTRSSDQVASLITDIFVS